MHIIIRLTFAATLCVIIASFAGCTSEVTPPTQHNLQGNPVVTRVSPDSANAGDTITIVGNNFGAQRCCSGISIGAVYIVETPVWSDTLIKAIAPVAVIPVATATTVSTSGGSGTRAPSVLSLEFAPGSDSKLLATYVGRGAYESTNSGISWNPLPHGAAADLAVYGNTASGAPLTILAASDSIIWNDGAVQPTVIVGHTAQISSVHFSPVVFNYQYFVTASYDATVCMWDNVKRALFARMDAGKVPIRSASINDSVGHAAGGTGDGSGRTFIWNVSDRVIVDTLYGHNKNVNWVEYSHDGHYLVTASDDGTAIVWNDRAQPYRIFQILAGHTGPVHAARFSFDNNEIVTVGEDGQALVWAKNDSTGKFAKAIITSNPADPLYCAAFSTGGRIATGSKAGVVRVW